MLKTILLYVVVIVLAGCTQEAYYVDHEFGMAQNDAFDQQIAHKDYIYANSKPASMPGIHSEKIMDTYQNSFDRKTDGEIKNFSRGVLSTTN